MKATEQYFPVVLLFIMLYKVVLTVESVYEILKCDHSNESYWALLSCGAVYYAVLRISIYELTVNPGHAWTIFLKFERSFEMYMSVLKIANEISEFPYKFP